MLSILNITANSTDKSHISTAFKSIQLICADFLPNLTLKCLQKYILTVGAFGTQR